MTEPQNYGLLLGERETDFGFAGADSPIPYEVVLADGNWNPYKPQGEVQFSKYADSMGCVSFSGINSVETQEKQQTGIEVDYSDCFTAKDSRTTSEGNYFWRVADSIRKVGLVLESDWPKPANFTWETFYREIPYEIYGKAVAWRAKWRVSVQVIPLNREAFQKALKQAPIQVAIPGHAILAVNCPQDIVNYFDTYQPFDKTVPFTGLVYAYQYVLKRNNQIAMPSLALAKWLVRCLQTMEGYSDEGGVTYWGGRISTEGITAIKEYFVVRIPDRKKDQVADVAALDALGLPPTE